MAKLLLVEDDNNLREIYEARLQAEGYTIVSAKDGEEALVVAKAEKPDLVISDVMMPKISGFEMLDILRNTEELKHVKVIMLTALGQSDDQQRADKLGADRYLVKSQVTLEDIVKTAHELLADESAAPAPAADAPAPAAPPAEPAASASAAPAEPPTATPPVAEPPKEPPTEPKPEPVPAPATPPEPKPEPKPEPEPAPEPAAEPKPDSEEAKPAEDDAKPDPDASASAEAAESTADEEADVEAKIEDFVAGASSEPTTPDGPAAPVTPAASDDAAAKPKSDDSDSDDKLMADAVEQLVASADKPGDSAKGTPEPAGDAAPSAPPAPAIKQPTVIPINIADEDSSAASSAPAPEPAPNAAEPETVSHNKVITPPESDEPKKKDINELVAEEEAKEAGLTPGTVIANGSDEDAEDRPAGAAPAKPSDSTDGPDPNSIAL